MSRAAALLFWAAVLFLGEACKPCSPDPKSCASACDAKGPKVVATARGQRAQRGPIVPVSFMVATAHGDSAPDANAFQAWVDVVTQRTGELLGQCGLELDVLRAQLVAVPSGDLTVIANEPSATSAEPEPGAPERLTPQARRLLGLARRELPESTLAIVAVDRVDYYVGQRLEVAGGLAFPPLAYHHPDDLPVARGVLIGTAYGRCGEVPEPPGERTVAHELGHMLLNLPAHDPDAKNLMSPMLGSGLRDEQCRLMRENLERVASAAAAASPEPAPGTAAPK